MAIKRQCTEESETRELPMNVRIVLSLRWMAASNWRQLKRKRRRMHKLACACACAKCECAGARRNGLRGRRRRWHKLAMEDFNCNWSEDSYSALRYRRVQPRLPACQLDIFLIQVSLWPLRDAPECPKDCCHVFVCPNSCQVTTWH